MKKKIIIIALIIAVVGSGVVYVTYDYKRTHYADGMAEIADRLDKATSEYVSLQDGNNDLVSKLAGADASQQKGILKAQSEKYGIKLKDLSDKQLEKLKEKNEKIKTEISYIQEKLDDLEFGSWKYRRLTNKYYDLIEKQNEYQCLIDYNELY